MFLYSIKYSISDGVSFKLKYVLLHISYPLVPWITKIEKTYSSVCPLHTQKHVGVVDRALDERIQLTSTTSSSVQTSLA